MRSVVWSGVHVGIVNFAANATQRPLEAPRGDDVSCLDAIPSDLDAVRKSEDLAE